MIREWKAGRRRGRGAFLAVERSDTSEGRILVVFIPVDSSRISFGCGRLNCTCMLSFGDNGPKRRLERDVEETMVGMFHHRPNSKREIWTVAINTDDGRAPH